MTLTCIKGNGGRLTAIAIKRFKLFESAFDDPEKFCEGMDRLWKEKHGHAVTQRKPKAPKRVKTDADHKYCNGCESVLPVASFSVDRSTPRGLAKRCRECAAKNWKRVNHHLCKTCESWCVGQICRRCLTMQIRLRNSEMDIAASVSYPIWKRQREFQLFAEELANNETMRQSEKLKALLAWKPENSQS